jgi:hypothetical protein
MPRKPTYESIRHELDTSMLRANRLVIEQEQKDFVNKAFIKLHESQKAKHINPNDFGKLLNRLTTYKAGKYHDYIHLLAGAAHLGMLEFVIQGYISPFSPEQARLHNQHIPNLTD